MVKKKEKEVSFEQLVSKNVKGINYIFLGVGLTIFIMNITAFLSFVKGPYDYFFFDLSVLCSVLIVLVATYNIYNNK